MSFLADGRGFTLLQLPNRVEAALWRRLRFEKDVQCRTRLFDRYAKLARATARGERRRRPAYGLEQSDFEQLAYGGLLEAIDRFDPTRGAPFEAFARHRIRGAIADGLAKSSEGGAQYSHRRRIELERIRSIRAGETYPDRDHVAALADLAAALAIGFLAEGAGAAAGDAHSTGGYENVAWRDLHINVLDEIEQLPETERTVMQQHYLNGVAFVKIAALLGVSKGRVSQIHAAALRRVRASLKQA